MEVSKELLNTIADNLEAGEKCFIHKVTFEIITYPEDYTLDLDPDISIWQENIERAESDDNFIQVERMPSHEHFEMMEEFANSVVDPSVKMRLLTALEGRK